MKRKQIFDSNDPYSAAIKSLVKKTIIAVGAIVLVGVVSVAYLAFRSGLQTKSTKAKATETPQVLSATQEPVYTVAAQSTNTPTPTPIPTTAVQPTAAPTLKPSATPVVSVSPTPTLMNSPLASPTPKPQINSANSALDGFAQGNGSFNTTSDIRVGSSLQGTLRGFVSFDITAINLSNTKKVTLRLFQNSVKGSPFANGGDIRIDLINYGSSLDPADYATASIISSFATVSSSADSGWRTIDVTEAVKKSKELSRQEMQFRLHFNFEFEGSENYASYESSDNTSKTGNTPQLVIE